MPAYQYGLELEVDAWVRVLGTSTLRAVERISDTNRCGAKTLATETSKTTRPGNESTTEAGSVNSQRRTGTDVSGLDGEPISTNPRPLAASSRAIIISQPALVGYDGTMVGSK